MSKFLSLFFAVTGIFAGSNLPAKKMTCAPADSTQIFARLGNILKDTASTTEIIANKGLRVILKGYPKDFRVVVQSFRITTVKNNDTLAANIAAEGNFLSALQIQELRKLNGFGKIIFHDIRAVSASSRVKLLEPFSIVVRQ